MDVSGMHHVGHVVRDMAAARAAYERMGFVVPPPAFPALPAPDGGPARACGAGNAHVSLRRGFLELVTVGGPGADAALVPLEVPPEARARVADGIAATTARLAAALDRFEGLHILVFEVPDADVAAARLGAAGVPHGGVARMRGAAGVPLGFVEIDGGSSPEGRLAVAEPLGEPAADHPNGAVDLVGPVLCVGDDDLAAVEERYERYLDRTATARGPARVFHVGDGEVVLVPARRLDDLLPGERPPALPCFIASVVAVRDLGAAGGLLERAGVAVRKAAAGELVVPAAAALGAALVLRQA